MLKGALGKKDSPFRDRVPLVRDFSANSPTFNVAGVGNWNAQLNANGLQAPLINSSIVTNSKSLEACFGMGGSASSMALRRPSEGATNNTQLEFLDSKVWPDAYLNIPR